MLSLFKRLPGRLLFNDILPEGYPYVNYPVTEKEMTRIIADVHRVYGPTELVQMLDKMKSLGFRYATQIWSFYFCC